MTLQRPRRVRTVLGSLSYAHLSKPLFFGFRKETVRPGVEAWVAEPEKALLDWVYLRRKSGEPIAFDEIDFSRLDPEILKTYSRKFPVTVQKELTHRL